MKAIQGNKNNFKILMNNNIRRQWLLGHRTFDE